MYTVSWVALSCFIYTYTIYLQKNAYLKKDWLTKIIFVIVYALNCFRQIYCSVCQQTLESYTKLYFLFYYTLYLFPQVCTDWNDPVRLLIAPKNITRSSLISCFRHFRNTCIQYANDFADINMSYLYVITLYLFIGVIRFPVDLIHDVHFGQVDQ